MIVLPDSERVEVVSQDTMAQSTMWLFQVLPHVPNKDDVRREILSGGVVSLEMHGGRFNACLQSVHLQRELRAAQA